MGTRALSPSKNGDENNVGRDAACAKALRGSTQPSVRKTMEASADEQGGGGVQQRQSETTQGPGRKSPRVYRKNFSFYANRKSTEGLAGKCHHLTFVFNFC